MQSGAVSLQICFDDKTEKLEKLAISASETFDVQLEKDLSLLTIRHYKEDLLNRLTAGKMIVLRQQSPETVQVLMK
jgi:aspartate kinase